MLFNLVEHKNGKLSVVMTDSIKKVKARLKTLSTSHRGRQIKYSIAPAETNVKYQKLPHDPKIGGGDHQTPRLTKWD